MRDNENAVEVTGVKKKFKVYYDKGRTLKERALHADRNRYEEREVLRGVSFSIKKGEAVGLIGQNGCGKSTTLKLLTRIMYPDSGTVELKGRVSSLLELGAGFHPDMSGRENVYTNAAIFGLKKKEIDARMDEIAAFSELGGYMDNPVRTYSSGMYMRLAFSVAINVDADILLIDEILAVGDVNFQAKCFNKLMEIKQKGTTIVLVSHSMDQVERVCGRSIWLEEGLVKADGLPREVHGRYLDFMSGERRKRADAESGEKRRQAEEKCSQPEEKCRTGGKCSRTGEECGQAGGKCSQSGEKCRQAEECIQEAAQDAAADLKTEGSAGTACTERRGTGTACAENIERRGTGEARITKARICRGGEEGTYFVSGEDITFVLEYEAYADAVQAVFGICFIRNDGVRCFGTNTRAEGLPLVSLEKAGEVSVEFRGLALLEGKYSADVTVENAAGDTIDYFESAVSFEISSQRKCTGVAWLDHGWNLEG